MGQGCGESEGAIAQGDGKNVGSEPEVATEHGDKGIEGGIENGGLKIGCNESKNDDGGGGQEVDRGAMTDREDDSEEACPKRDPQNTFVHIGDRGAA